MQIHGMAAMQPRTDLVPFIYDTNQLGPHDILLRVSHCGICHSDIHMIDNDWQMSKYPLVPGHEVVGEVLERGTEVRHLRTGDRVGVGWQRSSCLTCRDCLSGNENLCDQVKGVITHGHGGFAGHLVMDSRFCFLLPSGIESGHAGPLMCGGITVYSALRHAGMTSGQRIGVIGVGGLGHMAVQFASRLGNHVVAFTTSHDKAELAHRLGAKEAVLVAREDGPPPLSEPLDLIISTVPRNLEWNAYLGQLRSDGTLTFVGAVPEAISVAFWLLLAKRRRIMASPIGGRAMIQEMLHVADRYNVRPMVETFPLNEVNRAIARVRDNRIRFRAVLTVS